jgi:peptidase M23-like protein
VRPSLRSLSLSLLLTVVLTGMAGLPGVSADPGDPSPEPSPTVDPTPSPDPTGDPTPDPTDPPTEPPPGGGNPSPHPTPSPGKDKGDGKKDEKKGNQDKKKKDPFLVGGPQNTARLVSILTAATTRGMSLEKALLKVVGPFPVAGLSWWSDDWHAGRCCPFPHLHQGLDMFAPVGTPLVAAADGYISQKVNSPSASGLGLEITDAQGTQYFYAHLSAFASGIEVGVQVRTGQVVGFVGDTGNARGTIPHLHFEYQPNGVPAPPKPWVDRWLKIAERKAVLLVQEVTGKKPKIERLTFRITRLFDLVDAERTDLSADAGGNTGELLLLTGLHPAATYDMARETAGTMSWEIDWAEEAVDQIASGVQEYQDEVAAQTLIGVLQNSAEEPSEVHTDETTVLGEGVAVGEGIGDPTAPVLNELGEVVEIPQTTAGIGVLDGAQYQVPGELDAGLLVPPTGQVTEPASEVLSPRRGTWRAQVGPGLARMLLVYGTMTLAFPGLTQTLWHEITAAIGEEGPLSLLRRPAEARFPAAAGTD